MEIMRIDNNSSIMEENFSKVRVSKFVQSDKENDRVNQLLK